ncbi:DedA family protein [Anaerobacillus sp. MEB173]|uniref:DedA family protein n=1 Tax=Anaerobacillus sp. MEB173 TaxID=3383345 RepID=UPI003F93285B
MELFEELIITYGYFGIIVALMGGIIGLPIPDEVLLTFVGYKVYQGKMSFLLSLGSAYFGAVMGITVSYLLGQKLGLPFLHKFGPKLHITEQKIFKTQMMFHKYGPFLLFIGYFIPGVRHITGYLSGISNYGLMKFALFAYSGAFVWVFTFITMGQVLGYNWMRIEAYLVKFSIYLVIILLIIVFIYSIYRLLIPVRK